MLMVVVVFRGNNNSILYFDAFSNFICGEYCNAYAYEWLIHSRIWVSQSNQTVNFCFTSDLHSHNIVIRVVHMHVDGCSSRGVYNHIIVWCFPICKEYSTLNTIDITSRWGCVWISWWFGIYEHLVFKDL